MLWPSEPLLRVLRAPEARPTLTASEWELLVRQARRTELLATVHAFAMAGDWLDTVPEAPRQHLAAADVAARHLAQAVRREVVWLGAALAPLGAPVVLLKGAGYLMAGLPAASGRSFSDIDLLVPRSRLAAAESALRIHGWLGTKPNAYDQRYYRRWMHELPPMRHAVRGSTLDVHHNILPTTARNSPDPALLIARSERLPETPPFAVLGSEDRVIHCATHLLCEGQFERGLRDLVDMRALLAPFTASPHRWPTLVDRARTLGLARPLYHGLAMTERLLGLHVPADILAALSDAGAARLPADRWLLALFERALLPPPDDRHDHRSSVLARGLLYVRGHYLRMPLRLLVPHLLRKAVQPDADRPAQSRK